jgi:hypothetical protein
MNKGLSITFANSYSTFGRALSGGVLNAVYMDFMQAFDKVPHTRLLVKMKANGEKICIWVQDFLSDRKQCVQVNGMKPQWLTPFE